MANKLIVTEVAELNALDAAVYYEQQQHGLGERFVLALEDTYRKILEHPYYYGYVSKQYEFRDICLQHFPYVVVYQILDGDILVLDVFNTSRKPTF